MRSYAYARVHGAPKKKYHVCITHSDGPVSTSMEVTFSRLQEDRAARVQIEYRNDTALGAVHALRERRCIDTRLPQSRSRKPVFHVLHAMLLDRESTVPPRHTHREALSDPQLGGVIRANEGEQGDGLECSAQGVSVLAPCVCPRSTRTMVWSTLETICRRAGLRMSMRSVVGDESS